MIKFITKTAFFTCVICLFLCAACNDFEELNTNPTKSETANPNSQLAYVQLLRYGDLAIWESGTDYCSAFPQQMMGTWSITNYGGQYRKNNNLFANLWTSVYGECIKNLADVLANTEDKPEYQNVRAVTRMYRVYYSMLLTDVFGDIPYFDAGKGYTEGNVKPAYDKQELIYKDFLKELKEAEAELNADGGTITGDIVYNGDLGKLRRFANALRLRVAMRLVKVDPDLTRSEVVDILNSDAGLFTSSADDALVKYNNLNDWNYDEYRRSALSQFRRGRDAYPTPFICAVFWNYLKDNDDPRLFRIGRAYYDNDSPNDPFNRTDLTEEILTTQSIDLFQPIKPGFFNWDNWPNGYWSNLVNAYVMTQCRPQLNNAFLHGDNPGLIISYAETQFLLAEAKVRWGTQIGGLSAEEYYRNAVTASMKYLNDNYSVNTISDSEISDFLTANPFPVSPEEQIKAINEQFWVFLLNDHFEAYANWRRSDYPTLEPSPAYGALTIDSQTIPNRFCYPLFESVYNKEGYDSAIEALGGSDNWNARVWWDKE